MSQQVFRTTEWTWKEFTLLLVLALAAVPVIIENSFYSYVYGYLQDSLLAGTLTGLAIALFLTAGVYVVAIRPHKLSWRDIGLRSFSPRYWIHIFGGTIALIAASILILLLMSELGIGAENQKTKALESSPAQTAVLIGFVSAAVISPIYEEIFYRGFIYKWIRMKWGISAGILISSIIFTIVHIPTYNTLPVNFVSGVIFAWVYEKSGSVWPGIIIHALFNGIAVALTAAG
ncbi:CPBP family intramembrane metalloprotease [Bacillus mangrovi]|uniref:CPBP family intramembrane metalloprotease n=1 Tax=Metabacillus mangrovi TaxID=1491830 RepID=A0A7X2V5P4_9BACI|nr:type II CAAX endopeptidase family protein [Metabacillus mangrovi]MTH54268.1 CPBP family intramembrane metalloprotease [Metabacillus mangrovi]